MATDHGGTHFGRSAPRIDDFVDRAVRKGAGSSYDHEIAYAMATLSAWSYADLETFKKKLKYYGLEAAKITPLAVRNEALLVDAGGYFVRSECGRLGVLAFRGTMPTDVLDWMIDAETVWREMPHGEVHSGFFNNVEVLWDDIIAVIRAATAEPKATSKSAKAPRIEALYITGHSLGGAMAVITASRVLEEPDPAKTSWRELLRAVYTFGQPMVGDQTFADHYDPLFGQKLFRHVYRSDVVCALPPSILKGYVHFGQEIYARSEDSVWDQRNPPRARQAELLFASITVAIAAAMRRLGLLPRVVPRYSLDDHSPANYVVVSRQTLIEQSPPEQPSATPEAGPQVRDGLGELTQ